MLGLCSLLGPAIAAGNTVVVLPSDKFPLVAADLCQVGIVILEFEIESFDIVNLISRKIPMTPSSKFLLLCLLFCSLDFVF